MYFVEPGTDDTFTIGFVDININYEDKNYIYDFTSIGEALNLNINYVVEGAIANIRMLPLYDSVNSNNVQQLN